MLDLSIVLPPSLVMAFLVFVYRDLRMNVTTLAIIAIITAITNWLLSIAFGWFKLNQAPLILENIPTMNSNNKKKLKRKQLMFCLSKWLLEAEAYALAKSMRTSHN